MKKLKALHVHASRERHLAMRSRAAQHQETRARDDVHRHARQRDVKKEIYRVMGKAEKRKSKQGDD